MKTIRFFSSLGLALMLFSACSNKEELAEQALPQTQTAYIELEGAPDLNGMRVAEIVDTSTGNSHGMAMANFDLNVRVAIRRGSGAPVFQTLLFTKVKDQNRVYYKGNVQMPAGGSGAYQLAAIILGEQGGRAFAETPNPNLVRFGAAWLTTIHATGANRGNVVYSMPYLVNWMNISVSADGKRIAPLAFRFRPNGTLLRFRITNTTQQTQKVKGIRIATNAFFRAWDYDMAKNLDAGNLWFGQTDNLNRWEHEYNFNEVTLEPNHKSPWFYLWVMPNKNKNGLNTEINVRTSTNELIRSFTTTHRPELGSVPVELSLRGAYVSGDFTGTENRPGLPETD